ncbi:PaaI family thioesterase [Streptomyces qinglanensis]|uniref:Acyl-coenzyme A thioesterase PaaI, contains HGG motif n=1 Tax=Streptomyces qinglanensis TaxID=943816 RepID=A0A1H9QWW4_9ACTN|nr:PaaI family thioesterase [Streptomyces qinglanensis]SER64920.1 Acyl-coenzyme A thioesterase PaaI, contains HGG motif [Streptomyces qinglanensis]
MGDRPVLGPAEIRELITEYLPDPPGVDLLDVGPGGLVFAAGPAGLAVRPGGTVSGPALFGFADVAGYLTVNAYLGRTPSAMLTSSSISFLEATEPERLHARVAPERIGRRTAVVSARVESPEGCPVALATLHFAFPGRRNRPGADAR